MSDAPEKKPDEKKPDGKDFATEMRKAVCAKFGLPDSAPDDVIMALAAYSKMGDAPEVKDKDGDGMAKMGDLPSEEKPGDVDEVKPNSATNFGKADQAVIAQMAKRLETTERELAAERKARQEREAAERKVARGAFSKWAMFGDDGNSGRWDPEDQKGLDELIDDVGGDLDKARRHVERLPPRGAFARATQGGHPVGTTVLRPAKADKGAEFSKKTWEIYGSDAECAALSRAGKQNAAFALAQEKARQSAPELFETWQ